MIQYVAIDRATGVAYAQGPDKLTTWENALNQIEKEFAKIGGAEVAMDYIELGLVEEEIE